MIEVVLFLSDITLSDTSSFLLNVLLRHGGFSILMLMDNK